MSTVNVGKGRGCVYSIRYRMVWCVKYRKRILTGLVVARLKVILIKQSKTHTFTIVEMETDGDHIHMLIECSPQHYIPNIMKALKGNSARFLFKEFPDLQNTLWVDIFRIHVFRFYCK